MPKLTVNGKEVDFDNGMTVLQACELAGEEIPRFCYHERLKIAGNCRMCLVQIEGGPPKPAASCAMPAGDGMVVHTNTPMVKKAREGVMEFLLINHPLDCPICDQGGECDLQDQAMTYGRGSNRFDENKRSVKDKYIGPLIKTHMTRCIHCTRCIRFIDDIAGTSEMGATGRGEGMEVGTFIANNITTELSGNVIDLCPVGALTSRPYAFKARSWELKNTETIDVLDAVGSNIIVNSRGNEVMRVLPNNNDEINEEWLSDKSRFSYDGLLSQRLDRPMIKKKGKLTAVNWNDAFDKITKKLKKLKPEEIAAIAGDLADVESVMVLKDIMSYLSVQNMDCRQDGALHNTESRGNYIFNTSIESVEDADICLLVGANPRYEASILNTRIRKAVIENGLNVYNIGDDLDLTYNSTYLGNDAEILEEIFSGKNNFAKKLEKAKKPMIVIGNNVLKREDGEDILKLAYKIADKYNFIQNDWNGFNVLQNAAGRIGALDLGFVPGVKGKNINEVLAAAENKKIKFVYLLGADELETEKLKDSFVVYQGHHGDKGANVADVILPGAAYTEKNATYVNLEGRVQRSRQAVFPPGKAKQDWEILSELAQKLETDFSYSSLKDLRERVVKENSIFASIDNVEQGKVEFNDKKIKKLSKQKILSNIDNFYMTNSISRSSATMAKCVQELWKKK